MTVSDNPPKEFRKFYTNKLSNYGLVYKHLKSTKLVFISLPIYLFGVTLIFPNDGAYRYWSLLCFVPFIISYSMVSKKSLKYLESIEGGIIKNKNDFKKVIRGVRIRELKNVLFTSGYDSIEKLEDLLNMISHSSEKSKLEKMAPYSILALFLWAIWNEYVGFRFNSLISFLDNKANILKIDEVNRFLKLKSEISYDALELVLTLTFMAIVVWFSVYYVLVKTFRLFILYKFIKDEELYNILRLIVHEMKMNR